MSEGLDSDVKLYVTVAKKGYVTSKVPLIFRPVGLLAAAGCVFGRRS